MSEQAIEEKTARFSNPEAESNYEDSYLKVSSAAIFSVIFAFASLLGLLFASATILALLGLGFGVVGLIGISKYPDELTGRKVALTGIFVAAFSVVSAVSYHTYVYATEVPPDHQRVTWYDIKSPKHSPMQPTSMARELNGKKVFVKGYVFPGVKKKDLKQFLLVGDFGMCCFGGDPQPSHVIKVNLSDTKVDHSLRLRKLSGTFRVRKGLQRNDEGKGYIYELDADQIK